MWRMGFCSESAGVAFAGLFRAKRPTACWSPINGLHDEYEYWYYDDVSMLAPHCRLFASPKPFFEFSDSVTQGIRS